MKGQVTREKKNVLKRAQSCVILCSSKFSLILKLAEQPNRTLKARVFVQVVRLWTES